MLKGILDFFRQLFSSLSGKKKKPQSPRNSPPKDSTAPASEPSVDPLPDLDTTLPDVDPLPEIDPVVDVDPVVTEPEVEIDDPIIVDDPVIVDAPQDGSDVDPDAEEVVVVTEEEPVIIVDGDPINGSSGNVDPDLPVVTQPVHTQRYLWCLDNGHGNKTAGKRSPVLPDGRQILEYRFNRDIVKRIIIALRKAGVAYYEVVPEVNTDNFLEGRVTRVNKKSSSLPKLFVSVHANAAPAPFGKWCKPTIHGIETWYYHNSRRGKKMASIFQKHLIDKTGFKNRHIKSRPSNQFYVLRKTGMTAVLTENGFYNNEAECKRLLTDKVRQQIAEAHVRAIMEIEKRGV